MLWTVTRLVIHILEDVDACHVGFGCPCVDDECEWDPTRDNSDHTDVDDRFDVFDFEVDVCDVDGGVFDVVAVSYEKVELLLVGFFEIDDEVIDCEFVFLF